MYVYKENDLPNDVYIIKSGEFKVIKTLTKTKSENSHNLLINRPNKMNKLEICLLGPGEAFGEEEVLEKIPRLQSIICNSITGVVFVIDQKEFLKRVSVSQKTNKQLKEQINSKAEWREKRLEVKKNAMKNDDILFENTKKNTIKKNDILLGNIKKNAILKKNTEDFIDLCENPDEFAMIKGSSSSLRDKNAISNMKNIYKNPLKRLEQKKKKKGRMIPVIESIVDPVSLIGSLKDKSFLRQLTANSPKSNFFLLNNLIRQEKRKEELINYNKVKNGGFEKKPLVKNCEEENKNLMKNYEEENKNLMKNCEEKNENLMNCEEEMKNCEEKNKNLMKNCEEKKLTKEYYKEFKQIVLPMSNSSINNYLKIRFEDEYQLNSMPRITIKHIEKPQKTMRKNLDKEQNISSFIIGNGDNSQRSDQKSDFFTKRRSSLDYSNNLISFLPLKYSSEALKRNAHTPSLSLSIMIRKTSKNELYEEEFLTTRNF